MKNDFCPDLMIALDRKAKTDATLLRLCEETCAGTIPYSKAAVLSAMERCDDAMDDVWRSFKPNALAAPTATQEMPCLTN